MLTAKGRVAADRAVRRHRLLERLASDFLGYPPAESYEQARLLDGAFDDEAIERVSRALGDPHSCPHGWPVDPVLAREEGRELSALATLSPGEEARVARLVEEDGPVLAQLYELGLAPGAQVTRAVAGATAQLRVRIGDRTRAIDARAATKVLVRRGE
jgi:DtxR family Mn-dependent transcriptional regulator